MFEVKMDVDLHQDGLDEVIATKLKIVGTPDEDLEEGKVLLICDGFSLEVDRDHLARALRAFEVQP